MKPSERIDALETLKRNRPPGIHQSTALDIALKEDDLVQIKEELMEFRFRKKRPYGAKRPKITSRLYHLPTDGFDIYVGKRITTRMRK